MELLRSVSTMLERRVYQWKITEGLTSLMFSTEKDADSVKPADVLLQIKLSQLPAVYLLVDFHPYLDDPVNIRLIKDIIQQHEYCNKTLIFLGSRVTLPAELGAMIATFELKLPNQTQIKEIVKKEARKWTEKKGLKVKSNKENLEQLIKNLSGLTQTEVKRLAQNAIYDDGAISESDLPNVMKTKYQLLNQEGILHFEYDKVLVPAMLMVVHLKDCWEHF